MQDSKRDQSMGLAAGVAMSEDGEHSSPPHHTQGRSKKASRSGPKRRRNGGRNSARESIRSDSLSEMPVRAQSISQLAPEPSQPIPVVYVKNRISQPLLYRKRIGRVERARPGDLVAVYTEAEELIGYGLYNPRSEIAVRMLWYSEELPDDDAWDAKLKTAVALRRDILNIDRESDSYRVVHAESDGLSGLVIDKFGDVLSAEAFSLGMYQRAQAILDRLAPMCDAKHTIIQSSPAFNSQEGCEPPTITSPNLPQQVTIREHDIRFRVRFEGGHKTGFFCDQRENRKRLAKFCAGKTVLDLCCYTGGFSVTAKKLGNAAEVTGVDLDESPIKLAKENANLNQVRVRFVQADAFAYMREMIQNGRQFDVVILDPPKLIRTRTEIEEGTKKHFALNRLAMRLVKPGGLLLSCSCAGLLPESEFIQLLVAAARQSGPELCPSTDAAPRNASRTMQILAKTGAAADHPVISNCLETEYLKAVWMLFH